MVYTEMHLFVFFFSTNHNPLVFFFFFLIIRRPPISPLFPLHAPLPISSGRRSPRRSSSPVPLKSQPAPALAGDSCLSLARGIACSRGCFQHAPLAAAGRKHLH